MYRKQTHVHFVGIAGIGMSGIAHVLLRQGYRISGCDLDISNVLAQQLKANGALLHSPNNSPECFTDIPDVIVYSSAISHNHPELVKARELGITIIPRAVMLAELMRTKWSVAIAGSHGKTTTTSLVGHILMQAAYDPTVIIGGIVKTLASNAHCGSGNILVAEADESDKSLVRLTPTIGVITNIDYEHVDIYADELDLQNTFRQFIESIPFYGKAILCDDDEMVRNLLPLHYVPTCTYGFSTSSDLYATNVQLKPNDSTCDVWYQKKLLASNVAIPMAGRHNVLNSLAAFAVCLNLDVSIDAIVTGLATFSGVDRRFTFRGMVNNALLFDDYGHHPTEIEATTTVAYHKANTNKVVMIFQPHRFTRTKGLWNKFVKTFCASKISTLIITDIYSAGEAPIENINSRLLAEEIAKNAPHILVQYIPHTTEFDEIIRAVIPHTHEENIILIQGAGSITKLADPLQKAAV